MSQASSLSCFREANARGRMFTVGKMQKCKIAAESAERPPTCNTSTHYTRNDIYNILRVYRYVAAAASKVTTPLALHSILFGKLLGISVAILAVYLVRGLYSFLQQRFGQTGPLTGDRFLAAAAKCRAVCTRIIGSEYTSGTVATIVRPAGVP